MIERLTDSAEPAGFTAVPLSEAYKLVTPGMPILVASKGMHYNLTPIAWNCPLDYEPVTKLLFVCDPSHQTAINIRKTGEFAICVPFSPKDLVIEQCGSVSGPDIDKFARFSIPAFMATKSDARIYSGSAAFIECKLIRIITEGSVEIILGEALAAFSFKTT